MKNTKKYLCRRAIRILLPLFCLCTPVLLSQAADYYVDDDCVNSPGTGSSTDPFCSIVDAVATASTTGGDVVLVHDGTYNERVSMKTGVTLRNVTGEQPTITIGSSDTLTDLVTFSGVDNAVLDGFIVDATATASTAGDFALVRITGPGTGLTVSNCTLNGASTATDARVMSGIHIEGQLTLQITGNTITHVNRSGISTGTNSLFDSTVTIQGNTIEYNGQAGIQLIGTGTGNLIQIGGDAALGNLITNNGNWGVSGSGIRLTGLQAGTGTGVVIDNNVIAENGRNGLLIMDSDSLSPHITGNTIYSNFASGINIGGDSTLTIGGGNQIFNNGLSGIAFFVKNNSARGTAASSAPVLISDNTIHNNSKTGIAVIDNATGLITIQNNSIYQNSKAGIGFFNNCTSLIRDNDIHDHAGAAGIFTGTWSGGSPSPDPTPTTLQFNRANGPAHLTIMGNKIYNNRNGMRLDHASGTITNNLIHHNSYNGIRFSGNNVAPYAPFGVSWGITSIVNNTVVDNGTGTDNSRLGSGIYFDDINNDNPYDADGPPDEFYDPPYPDNSQGPRTIENNIVAYNARTGIRDAACTTARDYNLYYDNNLAKTFIPPQITGCAVGNSVGWSGNPHELFTDPLFVDRIDYRLQSGSPGKATGRNGVEMGAYGGSTPLNW